MIRSIPPITSCGPNRRDARKRASIRIADPVKFRTRMFQGQVMIGNIGNRIVREQDIWKPHVQTSRKKLKRCFVSEPPKYPHRPIEEIFEDEKTYQVVIEMFHHYENEMRIDIKEDILSVESAKSGFSYYKEFLVPLDVLPESRRQTFKNSILAISFEKQTPLS